MKFLFALLACLMIAGAGNGANPTIWRGPICGAVTPDSAWVKAKLGNYRSSARLAVSKSADLSEAKWFGPMTADTNRGAMVEFRATGLVPDTQYFYALEVDGTVRMERRGAFKTFPPADQPASFNFAFASCARTGSQNPVFERIREVHPLFYMNVGDFHYLNITSNALVKFRMAYDKVLESPVQAALYRSVPFIYIWDDHDFAGNNSDRRSPSHFAARSIYEEYVPHYDMP
ncbi:MAG TPA: hypothetical protein VGF13_03415, partial [Verrucomicrobiae bacterium]